MGTESNADSTYAGSVVSSASAHHTRQELDKADDEGGGGDWNHRSSLEYGIFGVLFTLSKEQSETRIRIRWVVLKILLDAWQLFSTVIGPEQGWSISSSGTVWNIIGVLNFTWLTDLGYDAYLAVLYCTMGLLAVNVAMCVWVAWCFKEHKFPVVWPVQVLRVFSSIFFQAFDITALNVLQLGIRCHYTGGGGGATSTSVYTSGGGTTSAGASLTSGTTTTTTTTAHMHFELFPDHSCLSAPHIFHFVVSAICLVVYVAIALVINMAEVEVSPLSRRPLALGHSGAEVFAFGLKVVLTLVDVFLGWRRVVACCYMGLSLMLAWQYIRWSPHLVRWVNHAKSGVAVAICWCCAALLLLVFEPGVKTQRAADRWADAMTYAMLAGLLPAFMAGWGLSWASIRYMDSLASHALANPLGLDVENAFSHFDGPRDIEIATRCCRSSKPPYALKPEDVRRAHQLIKAGLKIFPDSGYMVLLEANFMISVLGVKQSGERRIEDARKLHPSLMCRFILFTRQQQATQTAAGNSVNGSTAMDLLGFVEYQRKQRMVVRLHREALQAMCSFWRALDAHRVSFNALSSTISKIEHSVSQAHQAYRVVLERYGNNPKLVRLYGKFLQSVKNDPWRAARYFSDAERLEELQDGAAGGPVMPDGTPLARMDDMDSAVILVNASGVMQMVNRQTYSLFGYKRGSLDSKPLSLLLAPHCAGALARRLAALSELPLLRDTGGGGARADGAVEAEEAELETVGLHFDRLAFPVTINFRKASGIGEDSTIVALIDPVPQPPGEAVLWVTHNGTITACDPRFVDTFGWKASEVQGSRLSSLLSSTPGKPAVPTAFGQQGTQQQQHGGAAAKAAGLATLTRLVAGGTAVRACRPAGGAHVGPGTLLDSGRVEVACTVRHKYFKAPLECIAVLQCLPAHDTSSTVPPALADGGSIQRLVLKLASKPPMIMVVDHKGALVHTSPDAATLLMHGGGSKAGLSSSSSAAVPAGVASAMTEADAANFNPGGNTAAAFYQQGARGDGFPASGSGENDIADLHLMTHGLHETLPAHGGGGSLDGFSLLDFLPSPWKELHAKMLKDSRFANPSLANPARPLSCRHQSAHSSAAMCIPSQHGFGLSAAGGGSNTMTLRTAGGTEDVLVGVSVDTLSQGDGSLHVVHMARSSVAAALSERRLRLHVSTIDGLVTAVEGQVKTLLGLEICEVVGRGLWQIMETAASEYEDAMCHEDGLEAWPKDTAHRDGGGPSTAMAILSRAIDFPGCSWRVEVGSLQQKPSASLTSIAPGPDGYPGRSVAADDGRGAVPAAAVRGASMRRASVSSCFPAAALGAARLTGLLPGYGLQERTLAFVVANVGHLGHLPHHDTVTPGPAVATLPVVPDVTSSAAVLSAADTSDEFVNAIGGCGGVHAAAKTIPTPPTQLSMPRYPPPASGELSSVQLPTAAAPRTSSVQQQRTPSGNTVVLDLWPCTMVTGVLELDARGRVVDVLEEALRPAGLLFGVPGQALVGCSLGQLVTLPPGCSGPADLLSGLQAKKSSMKPSHDPAKVGPVHILAAQHLSVGPITLEVQVVGKWGSEATFYTILRHHSPALGAAAAASPLSPAPLLGSPGATSQPGLFSSSVQNQSPRATAALAKNLSGCNSWDVHARRRASFDPVACVQTDVPDIAMTLCLRSKAAVQPCGTGNDDKRTALRADMPAGSDLPLAEADGINSAPADGSGKTKDQSAFAVPTGYPGSGKLGGLVKAMSNGARGADVTANGSHSSEKACGGAGGDMQRPRPTGGMRRSLQLMPSQSQRGRDGGGNLGSGRQQVVFDDAAVAGISTPSLPGSAVDAMEAAIVAVAPAGVVSAPGGTSASFTRGAPPGDMAVTNSNRAGQNLSIIPSGAPDDTPMVARAPAKKGELVREWVLSKGAYYQNTSLDTANTAKVAAVVMHRGDDEDEDDDDASTSTPELPGRKDSANDTPVTKLTRLSSGGNNSVTSKYSTQGWMAAPVAADDQYRPLSGTVGAAERSASHAPLEALERPLAAGHASTWGVKQRHGAGRLLGAQEEGAGDGATMEPISSGVAGVAGGESSGDASSEMAPSEAMSGDGNEYRRGKRFKKLIKLLESPETQQTQERLRVRTLAMVAVIAVVHVVFFALTVVAVRDQRLSMEDLAGSGKVLIDMHRILTDLRSLDVIQSNRSLPPNIYSADDTNYFLNRIASSAEDLKVHLNGIQQNRDPIVSTVLHTGHRAVWSQNVNGTDIYVNVTIWDFATRFYMNSIRIGDTFSAYAGTNQSLGTSDIARFLVQSGPDLWRDFRKILDGLLYGAVNSTHQVDTLQIAFLIVEGAGLSFVAACYLAYLLRQLAEQRYKLYGAFLMIPVGLTRSLANDNSRQLVEDDDEDGEDDEGDPIEGPPAGFPGTAGMVDGAASPINMGDVGAPLTAEMSARPKGRPTLRLAAGVEDTEAPKGKGIQSGGSMRDPKAAASVPQGFPPYAGGRRVTDSDGTGRSGHGEQVVGSSRGEARCWGWGWLQTCFITRTGSRRGLNAVTPLLLMTSSQRCNESTAGAATPFGVPGSTSMSGSSSKRMLKRDCKKTYLALLPFIIWSALVIAIYTVSVTKLNGTEDVVAVHSVANFMAGRIYRTVFFSQELSSLTDPVQLQAKRAALAEMVTKTRDAWYTLQLGNEAYKATGTTTESFALVRSGIVHSSQDVDHRLFNSGSCSRLPEDMPCYPPGHRFFRVTHTGVDSMMQQFMHDIGSLASNTTSELPGLADGRFDFIYNVGSKDLLDGMVLVCDAHYNTIVQMFDSVLILHIILFLLMWIIFTAFLFFMLGPLLRQTSKERRRIAELMNQLPTELDVERIVRRAMGSLPSPSSLRLL